MNWPCSGRVQRTINLTPQHRKVENAFVITTPQDPRQAAISPGPAAAAGSPFEKVTIYHWLVVIIASCGWLFDCMDQRLFVLARESALKELLSNNPDALA